MSGTVVTKVRRYWLEVAAMTNPMRVREDPGASYSAGGGGNET